MTTFYIDTICVRWKTFTALSGKFIPDTMYHILLELAKFYTRYVKNILAYYWDVVYLLKKLTSDWRSWESDGSIRLETECAVRNIVRLGPGTVQ